MSSWLLRSHKIYTSNWLQLPNSFAVRTHTPHTSNSIDVVDVGLFLCVQQAACRQIQQCRTYYSLTHAKLVLVFSRAVDLLHIEWFSESPPRAHKRYRKSYGSQRKHIQSDTRSSSSGGRRSSMHDGITEIHTRHLLGNQSARAAPNDLFNHVEIFKMFEILFVWRHTARERTCVRTDWHVNFVSVNDTRRHSQTDFNEHRFVSLRKFAQQRLRENGEILMWIKFLRIVTVNSEVKWIDFFISRSVSLTLKGSVKISPWQSINEFFSTKMPKTKNCWFFCLKFGATEDLLINIEFKLFLRMLRTDLRQ